MRWLTSAFLTNSTYTAVSGIQAGNSGLPVHRSNHCTSHWIHISWHRSQRLRTE